MLRKLAFLLVFILALAGIYVLTGGSVLRKESPPKEQAEKLDKIKLGHGVDSIASFLPILSAREGGFFKKYNLEVEEVAVGKTVDAMVSGSVDVAATAGFTSMLTAAIKGGDVVWIAAPSNNALTVILSRVPKEEIRVIAAGSPNSTSHYQLLIGLQLLDIPTKDLQLVPIESAQATFAALERGHVDAIVASLAEWHSYEKQGNPQNISVLFDYRALQDPLFPVSLTTRKEVIDARRDVLVRFLAAILEGETFLKENPDKVKTAVIAKFQISEDEAAERILIAEETIKNLRFIPDSQSVKRILGLLEANVEEAKSYDPNAFVDDSMAKEAMSLVNFPKILEILNQ